MRSIFLVLLATGSLMAGFVKVDMTVRDSTHKLIWQDSAEVEGKELLFDEAQQYCEDLVLQERDDWRLPSVYELQSITDLTQYDPALQRGFHFGRSEAYWSSTPYADDKTRAWFVNFKSGSMEHKRHSYSLYVRCVRNDK